MLICKFYKRYFYNFVIFCSEYIDSIDLITGSAIFIDPHTIEVNSPSSASPIKLTSKHFIIAVGSHPISLPNFPFDNSFIISSDAIVKMRHLPETLLIVGAGAIGIEMVWNNYIYI